MNKYIITLCILASLQMFGQVTIGKTTAASSPSSTAVSLELGNATGGVKGLVLPWVTGPVTGNGATAVPAAVPGTIVFDAASTQQKVKFARANVGGSTVIFEWFDLSNGALLPNPVISPDAGTDVPTAKTQIGGVATDATPGVLVLADTNKAMVLPRVNSYTDIVNPSAGMMVFVTGTTPRQLAVFNGREWSFWKP